MTTQTKVSGDDAHAVVMRGCLQRTTAAGFLLLGTVSSSGGDLKSKSTVKTDVDRDGTTVKGRTETKADNDHHGVATAGSSAAYAVTPRQGIDLAGHAGEEVEISAAGLEVQPALCKRAGGGTSTTEQHRAAGDSQTAEALEASSASMCSAAASRRPEFAASRAL